MRSVIVDLGLDASVRDAGGRPAAEIVRDLEQQAAKIMMMMMMINDSDGDGDGDGDGDDNSTISPAGGGDRARPWSCRPSRK